METAIAMIQKLAFDFQTVVPNAQLIIGLLGLVLHNSLISFDKDYGHKRTSNLGQYLYGFVGKRVTK